MLLHTACIGLALCYVRRNGCRMAGQGVAWGLCSAMSALAPCPDISAGRRYNPKKGEVTLTCEKFPDREENRRDILDTIHALIAEGERKHPQTQLAIIAQQQERKAARENVPPMTVPEYNPLKGKQRQQQQ